MRQRSIKPRWEWWTWLLSMFFAFMLCLLTTEFKDVFAVESAVWQALVIGLAIVTGIAAVVMFSWWLVSICTRDKQTPESILAGIIEQIERDRAIATNRHTPQE